MRYFSSRLVVLLLLGSPAFLYAGAESQRYLRNGRHFYDVGQYEKSKGYFIAVLSIGTAKERQVARTYLAAPELKTLSHPRAQHRPPPAPASSAPSEKDSLLEEPEEAPERTEPAEDEKSGIPHLSGYLKNETAFRVSRPEQLSKLRTIGYLGATGQMSEELSYKISGRLYYDAAYDNHNYPPPVRDDMKQQGMLRDTYVDFSKGDWDVRTGKQQVVWGEAVGLFYADVVNAKDLREFVLPDFDFIRIPEWGIDSEYTKNDFHAEFVWLPFPVMDQVSRQGGEYAFALPVPAGTQVQFGPESTPSQSLKNSELGGRLAYRTEGWDLGVFHLRTWDKFPVYTVSEAMPGSLTLTATHPRLTVDGATFSKEVNEVVFKGECIYSWNKYFQTLDPSNPTGVTPKDFVDYLLGADRVFSNRLDTSLQIGQRMIRDYETDLFQQKEIRTFVTLWLKRPLWDNTLEPEVLLIKDVNSRDLMARPKITYKFNAHWRMSLGMDFFGGNADDLFGEFSNRNRAYTEFRYDF